MRVRYMDTKWGLKRELTFYWRAKRLTIGDTKLLFLVTWEMMINSGRLNNFTTTMDLTAD